MVESKNFCNRVLISILFNLLYSFLISGPGV